MEVKNVELETFSDGSRFYSEILADCQMEDGSTVKKVLCKTHKVRSFEENCRNAYELFSIASTL